MTENKRFYLDKNGINDREYEFSVLGEDELVDIINELNDENTELHIQNDFLKNENQHMRKLVNENEQLRTALKELREIGDYQEGRIQELNEENQELQQRNDRQCQTIDKLYTLIEKQDWKTLTGIQKKWSDYE